MDEPEVFEEMGEPEVFEEIHIKIDADSQTPAAQIVWNLLKQVVPLLDDQCARVREIIVIVERKL